MRRRDGGAAIRIVVLAAMLLAAGADGALADTGAALTTRRHAAYLELLGKGALWGAGYDYQPGRWLSFGAVGSFFVLRGERIVTMSPYVGLYPLGHGAHRLFLQAGPMLVRKDTPAPVPELPDRVATGVAAELSAGYELRSSSGFLLRLSGMLTSGKGGTYPWVGLSLGWTL